MTTWGAPDALTCLGARTFQLFSHLLGSHKKSQKKCTRSNACQRIGSAKQCSKLSLGQNKHGQNITTPLKQSLQQKHCSTINLQVFFWAIKCFHFTLSNDFKGSFSRVLRWVLLYINQKLFLRPIIASHKILTF